MIAIAGYLAIFVTLAAATAIVVPGVRYSRAGDSSKLNGNGCSRNIMKLSGCWNNSGS